MKAKDYPLLVRCIEEGYKAGFALAHKHTDKPSKEFVEDVVVEAILAEICDWFEFEEPRLGN